MTDKRIIFPHETTIAVVTPVEPPLQGEIEADYLARVAAKAVPDGVAYRIIDAAEVPADRSQRHLWTADFSAPDGYGAA